MCLYVCVQDSFAYIVAMLLYVISRKKKDLSLQLRSLKSLITAVKPSKSEVWDPYSVLG